MPLVVGQVLSYYEILEPLGAGAMGEVYRARDASLDRDVAIKVLPDTLAGDVERLVRFEREAKTLASLNHGNIATIFGVDQEGETRFLVLELVPGEDLAERLRRGALPLDEAIDVCRQIAEGLEAAHEAGVVHRDLKPANVRITPDGVVKILDFGLAKAMQTSATGSGTTSAERGGASATADGIILGTPTYMSPEQARGKAIDRRTDIWAFGCVLYECLTGKRIFKGENFVDLAVEILRGDIDFDALPRATPRRVRALLARTLTRDRRSRLRDVGEARVVLESPDAVGLPTTEARRSLVPAALIVALGILAAGLIVASTRPAVAGDIRPRLSVHVGPDQALTSLFSNDLAISRNGEHLAWIGGPEQSLHVRALNSFDTRALTGTEASVAPFFSPNGEWIGFYQAGALKRVRADGSGMEDIVQLDRALPEFRGASWGSDGWIVFAPLLASGLERVRESGGEAEVLTTCAPGVRTHRWPHVLRDADVVLYTSDDHESIENYDDASIVARSLTTGEERVVVEGAGRAVYAKGHLAFARADGLYVQRFDPRTLRTSGSARLVLSGVATDSSSGSSQFSLAEDGTLVHVPGVDIQRRFLLAWRSSGGGSELLDVPRSPYGPIMLAPSGGQVLISRLGSSERPMLIYDITRRATRRLSMQGEGGAWSADGEEIYFTRDRDLYALRLDSGDEPRHIASSTYPLYPASVVPDGKTVVAVVNRPPNDWDLVRVDIATGEVSELLEEHDGSAHVHPRGDWLAVSSRRSGREEIYLTRLSDDNVMIPVSTEGALDPHWSPDGHTLFFVRFRSRELWAVDVGFGAPPDLAAPPTLGSPRLVLPKLHFAATSFPNYQVASDGRILTWIDATAGEVGREVRVQRHWIDDVSTASER